jgi:hypothetical protein
MPLQGIHPLKANLVEHELRRNASISESTEEALGILIECRNHERPMQFRIIRTCLENEATLPHAGEAGNMKQWRALRRLEVLLDLPLQVRAIRKLGPGVTVIRPPLQIGAQREHARDERERPGKKGRDDAQVPLEDCLDLVLPAELNSPRGETKIPLKSPRFGLEFLALQLPYG